MVFVRRLIFHLFSSNKTGGLRDQIELPYGKIQHNKGTIYPVLYSTPINANSSLVAQLVFA